MAPAFLAILTSILLTIYSQQVKGTLPDPSALMRRTNSPSQSLDEMNESGTSEIFGVRWMLGDAFSQSSSRDNLNYYILMFNSHLLLQGTVQLQLANNIVFCSSSSIQAQSVNTTIYKCIVTWSLNSFVGSQVDYNISRQWMEVKGNDTWSKMQYKRDVLFQGTFKFSWQGIQFKLIFVGHWMLNDQQWLNSLKQQIKNRRVSLVLSTGDFFPELTEQTYVNTLTQLQYITSQLPLMITNSKNPSHFYSKLLISTFTTPMHKDYQNFLSVISLPSSNVAIVMMDPIEADPHKNELKYNQQLDIANLFQVQMNRIKEEWIKNQTFVIVVTPYSYICSEEPSCSTIENILKDYQAQINQIQKGLYLSASAYGYERSKPLCSNGTVINKNNDDSYGLECMIYVNEGFPILGPISEGHPTKNDQSQYRSFSTGFGVITLQNNATQALIKMTYTHIDPHKENTTTDSFIMQLPQAEKSDPQAVKRRVLYVVAIMEYGFILLLGACIGWSLYTSIRNKRSNEGNNEEGHVEMVEEIGSNPPQNLRNPINT